MNFVQVILQDAASGQITSMAEARKEKTTDSVVPVQVNRLKKGRTYHILVLQGHWNYTGINNDNKYVYDGNVPTLLGAGFSSNKTMPQSGSLPVTIDLDPIWIDTKFTTSTSGLPSALASVDPYIDIDTSGTTVKTVRTTGLVPVSNWNVAFTVYRREAGSTNENGFADLFAAQAAKAGGSRLTLQGTSPVLWIKNPGAGSTLSQITSPGLLGSLSRGGANNNVFTYTIPQNYTDGIGRVGTEGYVNFNLKYTPLAKTAAADWQSAGGQPLSKFFTVPEWIIRNGVNDKPQNERTNFENPKLPGEDPAAYGLNWNGAVPFAVTYVQSTPPPNWFNGPDDPHHNNSPGDGSDPDWRDPYFPTYIPPTIVFRDDGEWGDPIPSTGVNAPIKFETLGNFTDADWYYVVRPTVNYPSTPLISEFLANRGAGTISGPSPGMLTKHVTIPNYNSSKGYDVWVIAVKDYIMSQPLFIPDIGFGFTFPW
jgi:hypothetical protein